MAAPTPVVRGTPAGIKLKDGHSSLITIGANTTLSVWEKSVQPPGVDGGDAIPQTTMHNVLWRTMAPRQLKTMTESKSTCAYDPNIYTLLVTAINVETTITVRFSDGSTLAFYGFLQNVEFAELQEGEQPECTITITPTNFDHVNKVEAGPVLTSVAGT